MDRRPQVLAGPWATGFALDVHTLSSEFLGHNEFGHAVYETIRSESGDLLYRLKYRGDLTAVEPLVALLAKLVRKWRPPVDLIVPMPPSNAIRKPPVVALLAAQLGETLNLEVAPAALVKQRSTAELKDIRDRAAREQALHGSLATAPALVAGRSVLLFDDLYRSGATAAEATATLRNEGRASQVYLLVATRTPSNR